MYLDQEEYSNETESYASVKRLKGKLKKVPARSRTTGVNHDTTIQKGLRKIIKRNINVTDFDQVFDVLITSIIFLLVNLLYTYTFVPYLHLYGLKSHKVKFVIV